MRCIILFNYFGSKSKIADLYPAPMYETIIEPFAGAANYSLLYWWHKIILMEKNPEVYDVYKFLQSTTKEYLYQLPSFKPKERVSFPENRAAELLMFMCSNHGHTHHTKDGGGVAGKFNDWDTRAKKRIVNHLDQIKHWDIRCGDYRELENIEATWYIDPPYFKGGERYKFNQINYEELGEWCKSRKGQVIVCEADGAEWLPFRNLCVINTLARSTAGKTGKAAQRTEVIYYQVDGKEITNNTLESFLE